MQQWQSNQTESRRRERVPGWDPGKGGRQAEDLKQSEKQLQRFTDLHNDLRPMDIVGTDGSDQAADSE